MYVSCSESFAHSSSLLLKAKFDLLQPRKSLKRSVSKSRISLTLLYNIFLITDLQNLWLKNLKWYSFLLRRLNN